MPLRANIFRSIICFQGGAFRKWSKKDKFVYFFCKEHSLWQYNWDAKEHSLWQYNWDAKERSLWQYNWDAKEHTVNRSGWIRDFFAGLYRFSIPWTIEIVDWPYENL